MKGVSSHLPAFQCELPDLVAEGGRRKGLASQLCHVYAGILAGSFISRFVTCTVVRTCL